MWRLPALAAVLALAGGLFWIAVRTPVTVEAPGAVSTARAMADVAVIAARPHAIGSAANHEVRDYLLRRLAGLGLRTEVLRARVWEQEPGLVDPYISVGDVQDIVGVLPGRRPDLPALAIMAHYDSVAGSAGSGDDAAGVAAALEAARLIIARGTPERDVVLVFTDGEEVGMLGARAFFARSPQARRLGFVINLDVRGTAGRTMMYETGPTPAGAVAMFARTAPSPRAFSMFPFVYRMLPYGTDFTLARRAGIDGLNFSFMGGEFNYHTPGATVARMQPGAMAGLAGQASAAAQAVAFDPVLPRPGPPLVYGDLLGLAVIAYPPLVGFVLLLVAAALIGWAARRASITGPVSWLEMAAGAGAGLYTLALSASLMNLAGRALEAGAGRLGLTARFEAFEAIAAVLALGSVIVAASASRDGRHWRLLALLGLGAGAAGSLFGGIDLIGLALGIVAAGGALAFRRATDPAASWLGGLLLAWIVGLTAQAVGAEAAPVVVWPLLAASLGAAATDLGRRRGWPDLIVIAIAAVSLAWLGVLQHLASQALDLPAIGGLTAWLAALSLWPLLTREARPPTTLRGGTGLIAAALIGVAVLFVTSPWSADAPRPVGVLHVTEGGQSWRFSSREPEGWTRRVLSPGGEPVLARRFPGLGRGWAAATTVPQAPLERPGFALARTSGGLLRLSIAAAPHAGLMTFDLTPRETLRNATMAGSPSGLFGRAGQASRLTWSAAEGPLEITFAAPEHGSLAVDYAAFRDGWPAEAAPLPPLPADRMAMGRSGSTVTVGRQTISW